jgi:hypothetical protein
MSTKAGTLLYELRCIAAYLEIPTCVARDLGRDEAWRLVREAVAMNTKVRLVDYELRDLVRKMLAAQMSIRTTKGRTERDAAISHARQLEDRVRELLREDE